MKIAIAQMNTRTGDLRSTVDRMVDQSRVAAGQGVRLLVFPVPVLVGPDPGGLSESEEFVLDVTRALEGLSESLACPAVVPVVVDMGQGVTFEACFVHDGEVMPLRLVSYLVDASHEAGREQGPVPFDPTTPVSFELDDTDFGVAFDRDGLEAYASGDASADVIVYLPFYCYDTDDEATALAPSVSDGCFVKDASDANAWIVAAGAVGGYDEQVFTGGSFVMAPWGELALVAPSFEEALSVCEVDPLSEGPLEHPVQPPSYQRMRHLWDALVLSTRDFCGKGAVTDVVLAMGGDLPTSALAALAVDALGPTHVHGLVVPRPDAAARDDALSLAHNLRIDVTELDAGRLGAAASALGEGLRGPVVARGLIDVALSARALEVGGIVLSPADKTSHALDADSASVRVASFAPFGDVYRTDVAALARQRNTVSPVIPPSACARFEVPDVPGADALATTREARLNALDAILLLHVERSMGLSAIVEEQPDADVVAAVLDRVQSLELARRTAPPCPVVSDRTLSERDWPLGLAWHDHVRDKGDLAEADDLHEQIERLIGRVTEEAVSAGQDDSHVADVMGFLRDFAQGGGMHADGDDLWGTGLFSKN